MALPRKAKFFRRYDEPTVIPVSEYRGLSPKDQEWLEKFNVEWTANNRVEEPIFNEDQRRESDRRQYHRRCDALNIARFELRGLTHDPTCNIERLIDRHHILQKRIRSHFRK